MPLVPRRRSKPPTVRKSSEPAVAQSTKNVSAHTQVEDDTQMERPKKGKSRRRRNPSVNKTEENNNEQKSLRQRRNPSVNKNDEGNNNNEQKSIRQRRNPSAAKNDESNNEVKSTRTRRKHNTSANGGKTEENQSETKCVLRQFALSTVERGVNSLVTEFADIKQATSVPPVKTAFDANADKNRYKDVLCADDTRVVLTWPTGSTNDYIHANYVTVKGQKRFICTQGPTEKTIDDFWRMVWEQKCRAIVMLCNVMEQGKKKCELYYPDKLNDTMTTPSNVTIKNIGCSDSEKVLTITNLEVSVDGETTPVKHYLWNAWPDRGVPQNIMACLRLLAQLKPYTPVIVHCSAGIGRTGTIVGLEMAQQTILNGEPLSMSNIVKELRSFRHGSVQNDIQYVYMHRVMMGLAENKKVVSHQELAQFFADYDAFLKSRGC